MDIEALREDWHRATENGRTLDAIGALTAVERAQPKDALWSQRLGEAYRRAGQTDNAMVAFSRACERFVSQGLLPRGRKSDGLYLLCAGNIVAESTGAAARIALGSAFGHGSLLGQPVATTTVRAVSESVLFRMPAKSFSSFAMQYPPALAHLAETSGS